MVAGGKGPSFDDKLTNKRKRKCGGRVYVHVLLCSIRTAGN